MANINRATVTIKSKEATTTHGINLGKHDLTNCPHRYKFLFRHTSQVVEKLLTGVYGRKTTYVTLSEPTYGEAGRSYTIEMLAVKPLHAFETPFEAVSEKLTLTFELPAAGEE